MTDSQTKPVTDRRRASWVVLVRVYESSSWCAYGPMTHREALEFKRRGAGTGMDRQLANLIPYNAEQKNG